MEKQMQKNENYENREDYGIRGFPLVCVGFRLDYRGSFGVIGVVLQAFEA